jgi:hypothetical protein
MKRAFAEFNIQGDSREESIYEVILSVTVKNKFHTRMLPDSELLPTKSCLNLVCGLASIYRVIHEEKSIFLEVILSAIVRNKIYIDMLPDSELLPRYSCLNLARPVRVSLFSNALELCL